MAESVSIQVQETSSPSVTVTASPGVVISVADQSLPSISISDQSSPSISILNSSSPSVSVNTASSPGIDISLDPLPQIQVTQGPLGGGGGGSTVTGDIEVTNDDSAIGDALGATYVSGTEVTSIIADILAPRNPYVEDYNLKLKSLDAPSGEYVLKGTLFKVLSLELYLDRFDSIPNGARIKLYYNDEYLSQSQQISPNGKRGMVKLSYAGNITWASSNDFDNLEVEIPHTLGGSHREKIPIQQVNPIALYVSSTDTQTFLDAPTSAIEFLRMGLGASYDGAHQTASKTATLLGSESSEDKTRYVYIAVPESYNLDTITESAGNFGTSDLTNSFYKISESVFPTWHVIPGQDEYNVYLYRSIQPGALKQKSSLRVKVE